MEQPTKEEMSDADKKAVLDALSAEKQKADELFGDDDQDGGYLTQ